MKNKEWLVALIIKSIEQAGQKISTDIVSGGMYQIGDNDFHEYNYSGHFVISLLKTIDNAEMQTPSVIFEASIPNKEGKHSRGHIDLLVLGGDNSWALKLECKRLYSSEKAEFLAHDILRLHNFVVPKKPSFNTDLKMVLCSSFNPAIYEWWKVKAPETKAQQSIPHGMRAKGWKKLQTYLDASLVRNGLQINEKQYLLYAIWE